MNMEEGSQNPAEVTGADQETQVLYMSDGTYYTTAPGDGQEGMVTYMYGDDQSGETQYMMIQGEEGEGLPAAGEPYMVTGPDGSVQYVLVSGDMVSGVQPQFVLDQSAMGDQMTLMSGTLDDQIAAGGLAGTEAMQLSSEVDFLNSIEPVGVDPVEMASNEDAAVEKSAGLELVAPLAKLATGLGDLVENTAAIVSNTVGDDTGKLEDASAAAAEERAVEPELTVLGAVAIEAGTPEAKLVEATATPEVVSPVAISSVIVPSVTLSSGEGDKTRKGVENLTRSIRVTSLPLPSSLDSSKDAKPIITVKPSAVKSLDGNQIKIETMGGVQKVFILPMNSSSPEKTVAKPLVKPPLPLRIITQEKSALPVQTITLPLTSAPGSSAKVSRPVVSSAKPKTSNVATPNIIKRPVGRPPMKDKSKTPQQQKPGPVKIRPSSSQVIVIPIQIAKDSAASLSQVNGADTKVTPSSAGAAQKAKTVMTSGVKKEAKDKELVAGIKATPKLAKKQVNKSDDELLSTTRRSKRSSNMSMKLAEWGLLPTGNRSSSSEDEEMEEEELEFDDEDDEINEFFDEDDNESNSSVTLGIYAKSAQKGARKLASLEEKRFTTPVSTKAMYGKTPVPFTPGSSTAKVPQAPKEMQNKSLMCKPIMMTKATSCNPIRMTKVTQTEEDEGDVTKIVVPVPIPFFVPAPVATFSKPAPVPIPIPVPVAYPSFLPMTKSSISNILKKLKEVRDTLPADGTEDMEASKDTKAIAEGDQPEAMEASEDTKAIVEGDQPEATEASEDTKAIAEGDQPEAMEASEDTEAVAEGDQPEAMKASEDTEAVAEGDQPASSEEDKTFKVVDKEASSQPEDVSPASASGPQIPLEVLEMAMQIASQLPDDADEASGAALDSTAAGAVDSDEFGGASSTEVVEGELAIKTEALVPETGGPPSPKKARFVEPEPCAKTYTALRQVPVNDIQMKLKYSYGISAWTQWVMQKNAQLEAEAAADGAKRRFKPVKSEILQCNAEELNYYLCLFIREVRKPTGEEYATDSVYYLCLGIQHYLYENCRIDSLFTDACYRKFADALDDMLTGFEVRLNTHGQIVCRVTEEHLWESRQLGAHSPCNLLNTLVYFNTKHFMLNSVEGHLGLSFSNIMKQWKKNVPTSDGRPARTVFLRYNAVGPVITSGNPAGDANQRRKSTEMQPYEQLENPENPLRCPVKLYEFYLSKCPESIKHRNDLFYLLPEPSCVPDSPVWFSSSALGADTLGKMLNRIRIVREVQESQINQSPSYYT